MELIPNEIHVWRAALDSINRRAEILSPAERERAARFVYEIDRTRYINAHVALREILAQYLEEPADSIAFQTNEYGKPFLGSDRTLHFNLAHSHAVALIAVARTFPVGVDIEWLREDFDVVQLAHHYFARREIERVRAEPERFFEIWTRKEAFIKGIGMGVSFPLQEFDVCEERVRIYTDCEGVSSETWSGQTFQPAAHYVAAVVTNAPGFELRHFDWDKTQ